MATNPDTSMFRITESFLDYGFWVQYQSALHEDLNSKVHDHAELYIGESKLGGARWFISGIRQKSGSIVKVQMMASTCDHFFLVVKRDGTLYKYKPTQKNVEFRIERMQL